MERPEDPPLEERWASADVARRYAGERFAARARERDPRLVGRILREWDVRGPLLDVPCGAGRLGAALAPHARPWIGADVSAAMLAQARAQGAAQLVRATVFGLPFAERSFEAVVCCRLLHHFGEAEALGEAIHELVRVSARLVVASFWDAASVPAWRVRAGLKRPDARSAVPRARIAELLAGAGAEARGFRTMARFVSQQTFVVAVRKPA